MFQPVWGYQREYCQARVSSEKGTCSPHFQYQHFHIWSNFLQATTQNVKSKWLLKGGGCLWELNCWRSSMRKRLDKSNFWRECITCIFLRVTITMNVNFSHTLSFNLSIRSSLGEKKAWYSGYLSGIVQWTQRSDHCMKWSLKEVKSNGEL